MPEVIKTLPTASRTCAEAILRGVAIRFIGLGSVCLAAVSLHCSENLGRSPHPVSFQFKSNLPPEPLSKRL
jgi:hypothetical protein